MVAKVARLVGGAGTGKTTEVIRVMEEARSGLGGSPFAIGFTSFTRAARAEAVERAAAAWNIDPSVLSKEGWFRTVHSIAHRQLGIQKGELLDGGKDSCYWIAQALGVNVRTIIDDDTGQCTYTGEGRAAASLGAWELARARMEPLEATVRRLTRLGNDVPSYAACKQFVEKYEQAKATHGRYDFSDLLARFGGVRFDVDGYREVSPEGELPPSVQAWVMDEQQDASALIDLCCRRLASGGRVKWVYLAGDPMQCQPAGTPVLTSAGYKPIEDLDPESDWIISFNKKGGCFHGTGGGVRFKKAWRDVDSRDLFEVKFSDGTTSVCTSNHRWIVRTNRREAYATYIMKKGTRWRIGTAQMFANGSKQTLSKNGDFRLKMRMNQEDADAIWILRICDTDREARMYEQIASFRFGIPQVTFRPPCGCRNNLDAEFIETVFSELGNLTQNGLRCLAAHDLEVTFPFTTKADRSKNGSKACRFIQVPNLLPGIHVVPKLRDGFFERRKRGSGEPRGKRNIGKEAEWVGVESVRRLPAGEVVRVYSLEVERHHTYVTTNGIVTGNCIFGFTGSDSRHFMSWKADKERTMPKTWRCPAPIHALGEACLKRMRHGYWDRGIAPADHEGSVIRGGYAESVAKTLKPSDSTLILARCNYLCEQWQSILQKESLPFAKLKAKGSTEFLDAVNALWKLEHNEGVHAEHFAAAMSLLPATGNMRRGAKAEWSREDTWKTWRTVLPEDLEDIGWKPEFVQQVLKGDWGRLFSGGERWRAAASKHGPDIATKPAIRVGTIHAAKGMEADTVILSTTVTRRIYESQSADADQHDEERRVEYVGVTRAKRKLVVVNDPTAQHTMRIPT